MNKVLGYLGLIFLLAGLGLGIVSFASNSWGEVGDNSKGFFQKCSRIGSEILCSNNFDEDHRDDYIENSKYLEKQRRGRNAFVFFFF